MRKSMKLMLTAFVLGFTMVCGSVSAMAASQFKVYRVERDSNSKDVYIIGRISKAAVEGVEQVGFGIAKSEATAQSEQTNVSEEVYTEITYGENKSFSDADYCYYGVKMDKADINNFYICGFTKSGDTADFDEYVTQFFANETEIIK